MIQFENKGLIDLKTITTFGVSVKEGQNPIGMFGTGLKYALAVLLRTGHTVVLLRGRTAYPVSIKRVTFRGVRKEVVMLGDLRMPFTTELGKHWEPWQAFRELYCNALDEGGHAGQVKHCTSRAGHTRIVVDGAGIEEAWGARDSIILDPAHVPLWADHTVEVYAGASAFAFHRGVRAEALQHPARYTYNTLKGVDLTEDRTVKYGWEYKARVAWALQKSPLPVEVLREIVAPGRNTFEAQLPYNDTSAISDNFRQACREVEHDHVNANPSAIAAMRAQCGFHGQVDEVVLARADRAMLDAALRLLAGRLGVDVEKYPIHVVRHLGLDVLGVAENGRILLAYECFRKGDRTLVGTIYEEYLHLSTGMEDCTRTMQNRLLDDLISVVFNSEVVE